MDMPYSNVSMYKEIVEEAFSSMRSLIEEGRSPKNDGSGGYVIKYDPSHKSFKQSMIVVVFTGMWLEAKLHQDIISKFDEATFKKYDFKSYRDKLVLLGITDSEYLGKVDSFKGTRKELVHEKAYFDNGEIKTAQKEAELAYEVMVYLNNKG